MAAPMYFARFGHSVTGFLSFTAKCNHIHSYQTVRTLYCCDRLNLGRSSSGQWTNYKHTDGLDLLCRAWVSRGRGQSLHGRRRLSTDNGPASQQNTISALRQSFSAPHIIHRGLLRLATNPWHGGGSARGYRAARRVSEMGMEEEGDGARRSASGLTQAEKEDRAFHKGFMLRTAFENAFLSWTRNTYIMTVAGVTMYNQLTVPFAQEAAVVILMAGGVNMITGTSLYIYNLLTRRRHMFMSGMISFVLSGLSILHLMLWMGAIMVYLGYVEEDPNALDEEIRKVEDQYRDRKHRASRDNKRISDKYD